MNLVEHILKTKVMLSTVWFLEGGKYYGYFTNIHDLKHGDYVLVHTQRGITLARFNEYVTKQNSEKNYYSNIKQKASDWIIEKIEGNPQKKYKQLKKIKVKKESLP